MKIYTKSGDSGLTSLLGASRISKADARVDAYGEVDELNSCLGVVRAFVLDDDLDAILSTVQQTLFAIGATLADPDEALGRRSHKVTVAEADVTHLEQLIDALDQELPSRRRFVLPGGTASGAFLHRARSICRRAERRVVGLGHEGAPAAVLKYLNRLSDLLFVIARVVNHRASAAEAQW